MPANRKTSELFVEGEDESLSLGFWAYGSRFMLSFGVYPPFCYGLGNLGSI